MDLDQVGNVSSILIIPNNELGAQGCELDVRVVIRWEARKHDTLKGLLEQELLLCLRDVGSVWVVEAEELEHQRPATTLGVDAVLLVLLPLGENIGDDILLRY